MPVSNNSGNCSSNRKLAAPLRLCDFALLEKIVRSAAGSRSTFIPLTAEILYICAFRLQCNGAAIISSAALTLFSPSLECPAFCYFSARDSLRAPEESCTERHFLFAVPVSTHSPRRSRQAATSRRGSRQRRYSTEPPLAAVPSYYLRQSSHCHTDQWFMRAKASAC